MYNFQAGYGSPAGVFVKSSKFALLLFAFVLFSNASSGQTTTAKHSGTKAHAAASASSFAPLDRWKAAVVAGDLNALKAMYTTDPPARSTTPEGQSMDPSEEPTYWAGLAAQGLSGFDPKLLEIVKPQPGVVVLILRIEFGLGKGAPLPLVVAGAQEWVDRNGWKIVQSRRTEAAPAPSRKIAEPAKVNPDLYAPPAAAAGEISEALKKAKLEHKRVLLMFGGNWCFDCHVLDAALHSKAVAPLLNANYILVHVNIGDAGDENQEIQAKYNVPASQGVPAFAVLDGDGNVVYSQQHHDFSASAKVSQEDLIGFLQKWKPGKST
jgi:thioredoxin 1